MKGLSRNNLASGIITSVILILLISMGPVNAVNVTISVDKESKKYNAADESVTFTVSVDVEDGERIPVSNLTLKIDNSNGALERCVFSPTGNTLQGCGNITAINLLGSSPRGYGRSNMWGYGYGYGYDSGSWSWGYGNASFGYGYGYGYVDANPELRYNITWNLTKANPPDDDYHANLEVYSVTAGNDTFIYASETWVEFTIDMTYPTIHITSPEDGTSYPYTNVNLTYAASDANLDSCWYSLNGWDGVALANCQDAVLNATEGSNNVTVYVNDSVGNINSSTVDFSVSTGGGPTVVIMKNFLNAGAINPEDTVTFYVNISNTGPTNLTDIWLKDVFDVHFNFTNESNCYVHNFSASGGLNSSYVNINVTHCIKEHLGNGALASGNSFAVYLNFTAVSEGNASNRAVVNATDSNDDDCSDQQQIDNIIIGGGPADDWNTGLNTWQSKIESPYILKGESKLINFTIYRDAGSQSCLRNLTIALPASNFTYNGYSNTTIAASKYNFVSVPGYLIWNATGDDFFCGEGPENFIINVTSDANYGSSMFQMIAQTDTAGSGSPSSLNLKIFTTTTFSYSGTVYDIEGASLEGALASLYIVSFGEMGEVVIGTFSGTTDSNGTFNITDVPGLNVSLGGGMEMGAPEMGGLFYRFSATQYNDSANRYAMYVGPSLPELPESELRSEWGLLDPEIYLKPAVTFHIQVEGYDYRSEPVNVNETCPGPECPGWEPEFNWTNIGYSYELKDSKLGYPVSNDHTGRDKERYFSAPMDRNYSLMVFPEASFPIYIDFTSIDSKCNSTGYNISDTGVDATCTIQNGTHLIDVVIAADMNITPLTGTVDVTGLDDFWIVPYMLGGGSMIFDQDTLPFNMGNMMIWPQNSSLDDSYNLTSGEYTIRLPATQAPSDMMLMAFASKNGTYYQDAYKLSTQGKAFLGGSTHNFSLNQLITGISKTISSFNISGEWNETVVVNTTAVRFSLVDSNDSVLSTEDAFVEMKMETSGIEYTRMTNAQSGIFSLPVINGTGIEKLTIFSQSYAPVSAPVSASVLSGTSGTSTITCSNGMCNITLTRFDPFDPDNPNATLDLRMDFFKSNSTCDVPNPPDGCNMMGNESGGMDKDAFSPLQAILMGDISLRITNGNLSVHYVKTDLLASGPPDAAFSQNSTGTDLEAAWKFGSRGPEIYDEVLVSMPYSDALANQNIVVDIPLLYDNEFNVIWNSSAGDVVANLTDTDYADYLNTRYEAYLNGSNITCLENDPTLSAGLCYKDTVNQVIWMKIPHFSGVGPRISGAGVNAPENFTASLHSNKKYVILNWSGVSGADGYYIYYSSNVSEMLQLTPSNAGNPNITLTGSTNTTWTDTAANQTGRRYYALAAYSGSAKNFSTNRTGKFDIPIKNTSGVDGNLISLPLIPSDGSISSMIPSPTDLDTITRYDSTNGWQSCVYLSGEWDGDFTVFEPGKGYWFSVVGSDYNLTNVGTVPTSNTTRVIYNTTAVGGNLFGWESLDSQSISDLIKSAVDLDTITRYDSTNGWQSCVYLSGEWDGDFTVFEPGKGYWFSVVGSEYNLTYTRNVQ